MSQRSWNKDAEMVLADAGTAGTATFVPDIDSADQILDLGPARMEGVLVVDVTAVEIASNDELYTFTLQGSTAAAFTAGTIQNLAMLDFGATEVRKGAAIDSSVGRYEMWFCNEQDDITYRYLRLHVTVSGTIDTTGITFGAFIGQKQ